VRPAAIPPVALAACFLGAACAPAASAQPNSAQPAPVQSETGASIRASFQPERLGASTSLRLTVAFTGGEEGVPAPLRDAILRLPAGLGIDLRGGATCTTSRLRRSGAAGCPPGSIVGRGHGLADVYAGSLHVPEEAVVTVFRGPDRGGHPTFEIFGQGETPLYQSVISTAVLMPSSAPYGSMLTISIPPIPTLVFEPDASIVSVSVTVGATARKPKSHAAQDSILVPSSCPAGGFPFAASFTFAGGSATSATTAIPCP
jgi:hypothetical protein